MQRNLFECYLNEVLRRKIGQEGKERSGFSSAIAEFLVRRDIANSPPSERSTSDFETINQLWTRVDAQASDPNRSNAADLWIDNNRKYSDARKSLPPRCLRALEAVFVLSRPPHSVGAELAKRSDTASNATRNDDTWRECMRVAAELLLIQFKR